MGMWTQTDREIHRETRKRYPSDLTDGEWALTAPFLATYRPLSTTIRAIVEACLYLVAEGCRPRRAPPPAGTPSPGPASSTAGACAAAPGRGNVAGTAARRSTVASA